MDSQGQVGMRGCDAMQHGAGPCPSLLSRLRGVFRRGSGRMAAIFRRKSSHFFLMSIQGAQIETLLLSAVIPVDTAVGMEVYLLAAAGITGQKGWIYPPHTAGYAWCVPPYTRTAVLSLYFPHAMGRESPKEESGVSAFRTREGHATEGLFTDSLLSAAGVLHPSG